MGEMSQGTSGPAGGASPVGAILTPDRTVLNGGPPQLLRGLTPQQVGRVVAAGRHLVVHKDERVFSQGQPHNGIYLVETGRVRVFYVAPTGREITLAYWHPGNFVGGPEVYGRGRHMWSGVAMTSSRLLHLPGTALRQMVSEIPLLANGIIEGLIFKAKCYSALAQMLGTRSATERLTNLLVHLVDLYGVATEDGLVCVDTAISHADLASMTGVTRQSVTTTLKKLAEQGLVESQGSRLVIRDLDGLRGPKPGQTEDPGSQSPCGPDS